MPRKLQPPRLYLRSRKGREAVFVIRDGDYERSTGFGPESGGDAEKALAEYIAAKHATPSGVFTPDAMAIGTALTIYATEHAPTTADPIRLAYAIQALAGFWGDSPVSSIKKETCKRYAAERGVSDGTVRRELGALTASLNYCVDEGRLTNAPRVWLPAKPEPKDRWLTRSEAAALIRAARRRGYHHLVRFILIGLYTGTRRDAVLRLEWIPSLSGGHFDIEAGRLFRASAAAKKTKKRQTPIRIPDRLLSHLDAWRSTSRRYVIEWQGEPVKAVKSAWATVCKDAGVKDASPHTLRHTAITWAMQNGAKIEDASGYFGVSIETLQRVYWHHHPDYQSSVHDAFKGRFRG